MKRAKKAKPQTDALPDGWWADPSEYYGGTTLRGPFGATVAFVRAEDAGFTFDLNGDGLKPIGAHWLYWQRDQFFGLRAPTRLAAMILATQDGDMIAELEARAALSTPREET